MTRGSAERCLRIVFAAAALALLALGSLAAVTAASPLPENGAIVFMGSRFGGDYDILAVDPDGTGLVDLTNNSALDWFPSVSPDGSRIAFTSDIDGDHEIYVINADGSGRLQLTHNTVFDAEPAWSPDGTRLVFARNGTSLHVIDAGGGGEYTVDPGPNSQSPAWSPDGTRIAFAANRTGSNVDLFLVNATGGGLVRLTTDPQRDMMPDWSPDGSQIAFVSDRICNPYCYEQIWVMNADGTAPTALTSTAPQQNEWPAWSPDGTEIAFSRTTASGDWDLYRMNADGSGQTLVTTGGTFNLQADWAPAPPVITGVAPVAGTVGRYERFEAAITLDQAFADPFDPDEIAVDVTFTSPSGGQQVVPAFWYQPFTASGTSWESYDPAGSPGWRVRFAPSETGEYGYRVDARSAAGSAGPVTGSFTVTASTRKGFVRVDDRNGRYLRFDSGDPYIPVGHNVAFEDGNPNLNGIGYYAQLFGSLGRAGENWSRVWMTDFNRSALEWGTGHYSGFYAGPGRYSLPSAWRMDRILELAESEGVHVQLVLNDHGQFSTRGGDRWGVRCHAPPCEPGEPGYDPGNAYSAANGGPVPTDRPDLAFSNTEARELMKQRLRYVVARWGAFRSVLAWELINEMAFVGTDGHNPFNDAQLRADLVDWHADLAAHLKAVDAYDHLVTTSQAIDSTAGAGLQELNAVWAIPAVDLVQIHAYEPPATLTTRIRDMIAQFQASYGKPVLVGEIGLPGWGAALPNPEAGFDPNTFTGSQTDEEHLLQGTFLHNAMWAGAVAESMSAYWWWGNYIAADPARNRTAARGFPLNETLVPPLGRYLAGEDRAPLGLSAAAVTTTGPIVAVGSASSGHAYVWARDADNEYGTGARPGDLAGRTINGAEVAIPGLSDGRYRVRVYATWGAGGVTSAFTAVAAGGTLTVALPAFRRDLALKVDPAVGTLGDSDADGVDDAIDTGAGTFDDGAGTLGSLVSAPPGVTVLVEDITPDGVRITVTGAGTDKAVLQVCGLPGSLKLAPGSEVELTCGSVELVVAAGAAEYDAGGGVSIVVPAGVSARITDEGNGVLGIENLGGGNVTVVSGGVTSVVPPGAGTDTAAALLDQLVTVSRGAGLGKSLEQKAAVAAARYAAGDRAAACSALAGYVSEARAQRGKRALTQAEADELIGRAGQIRSLLRC